MTEGPETVGRLERPYNWRKVEKPKRGPTRARWAVFAFVAIVLVLVGLTLYVEYEIHAAQGGGSSAPFAFSVRSGDTDASVARRLQGAGYLNSSLLFRLDARIQGLGSSLRVGTYVLRHNMSIDQMVSALGRYKPDLIRITIPEGWRAEQIAAALRAHGISGSEFLHTVHHPGFGLGFSPGIPPGHTLEGFLFPDTYFVAPHSSGAAFARQMVQQFAQIFTPTMRAQARHEHRTVFRIVNMAALVEREDLFSSQKPLIASVYYNRLRARWLLQCDPTVQYGLGRPGKWWPVISLADYRSVQSPYNTYLHYGLPPEPIANPGLSSLEAALHPAHSDYFYFSDKGHTGRLLFTRTLAEQQANIQKYGG